MADTHTHIEHSELDHHDDHHNDHGNDQELWDGGKTPFKVSYGKLMMWYFLLSDAFTFAGFLIAYGTLRISMNTWPVPDFVFSTFPGGFHEKPLYFVTLMTFVLLASSFTMVRAVQEGHRENKNGVAVWMFLTILGGLGFIGCQAWEWNTLISKEHMSITRNVFSRTTEAGIYLDENGKPSTIKENTFESGHSYLIHRTHVADGDHGDAHGGDHHGDAQGTGHDHDDHHAGENHGHDHGYEYHYQGPGDQSAIVDKEGFVHRRYQATDGKDAGMIKTEEFGPKAFGALFFFITGFHGFHVASGIAFLIIIMVNVITGLYVERKNGYEMVEKIGLYWHFVDLVWVFVFLVFYLI